jgi:hypothetical protein
MIYEIRTYNLRPGAVDEYERRFAAAYPVRAKYSPLYGFWHTEIGPLNQLVHIWAYESLQQRADVRAAAAKDPSGAWPPPNRDLLRSQESEILRPIKGMTEWKEPQQWGGLYELRRYSYPGTALATITEKYSAALAAREAIYPVAGIWTSDLGNLNRLYQLFPYKDWAHRDELRAEFARTRVWPVHTEVHAVNWLVRHMVPAPFSPLH